MNFLFIKLFSIKNVKIFTHSKYNQKFLKYVFNFDSFLLYSGSGNYNINQNDLVSKWKEIINDNDIKFSYEIFKNNTISINKFYNHIEKKVACSKIENQIINSRYSKVIFISTQNRPHKNFNLLFEILNILKNDFSQKIFIVFTGVFTQLDYAKFENKYSWFINDCFFLTRLTAKEHANVIFISDLIIHPIELEGGPYLYPLAQGASLDTPGLMNYGRHISELKDLKNDVSLFVSNFHNKKLTIQKIINLLTNKNEKKNNIKQILNCSRTWESSGYDYIKMIEEVDKS